jgi:acyl-coenzyme A synthetase/AMP-(fatty) acid ligase
VCGERRLSYADVARLAARFGNVLRELGVLPEQRVIVGLPDIPELAAALFGAIGVGAAVVMVNNQLKPDEIAYFYEYTRARVAVVHADALEAFAEAARGARHLTRIIVVGGGASEAGDHASFDALCERAADTLDLFPLHRDDVAIWLFVGDRVELRLEAERNTAARGERSVILA